jgi:hypothetical protein
VNVDQFLAMLKDLGIDPALGGIGLLLAVLLRYARGMVKQMNSEWTFVTALVFGLLGAFIDDGKFSGGFAKDALSLACIVLVGQKVLEKAAAIVTWLPQDNEWVKVTPAATPTTPGGTK